MEVGQKISAQTFFNLDTIETRHHPHNCVMLLRNQEKKALMNTGAGSLNDEIIIAMYILL